jgi:hypothetical protein
VNSGGDNAVERKWRVNYFRTLQGDVFFSKVVPASLMGWLPWAKVQGKRLLFFEIVFFFFSSFG